MVLDILFILIHLVIFNMNLQDMKDTFIHTTFDIIFSTDTTTNQAGTYYLSTSTTTGTVQIEVF